MRSRLVAPGAASGPVLALSEGLSVWGGVDAGTGEVVDALHPQRGEALAGKVVAMPTSRGSCSGSGVLLGLALSGRAPDALAFREAEEVLTLGALVAGHLFDRFIPVLGLDSDAYEALAKANLAEVRDDVLILDGTPRPIDTESAPLRLSEGDRAMLDGARGEAARVAMEIVAAMARAQGARELTDVTRAHIDGCIYASPAFLAFAERMRGLGARVRVPTTTNAVSVDRENWRAQGVEEAFGRGASALADAYVAMGAQATFTCAPYLHDPPAPGERIGWSESNAVIYANSVLGARTVKHPDFLDLCIAVTGRAPLVGVYADEGRRARRIVEVVALDGADDALWPLLGWMVGRASPDRVPLVVGLEGTNSSPDDLKALCAAFGTTSAAPMLHVAGVTPEADRVAPEADTVRIGVEDMAVAWDTLNRGPARVDLVAIGSPHASASECHTFLAALDGRTCRTDTIVTLGRETLRAIVADGTEAALRAANVRVIPDLCWCSITEPVFPPSARTVMTNSGKYAHYGPGLSGRAFRFGSLKACADAAADGRAAGPPRWLEMA